MRVYQVPEMADRRRVFRDRGEAGDVLGGLLRRDFGGRSDVILLTIPMGGIPVAVKVAAMLQCPMDLIIVRKIQIPGNTEAGFGAMTGDGDVFFNEPLLERLGLTDAQIERQTARVRKELAQRSRSLRGARPIPELIGKTVVLVDDGLASGFTMKAALFWAKKRKASSVVVAVPTAPKRSVEALGNDAEAVYCPNIRDVLSFAVADAYENWYDLSEDEVRHLLSAAGLVDQPGRPKNRTSSVE